jgi:5'-deoxynucleotidase YfbR-like HD superfamily hydrolase
MKYTFKDVYPSWLEYQELSTVEAKIVALADVIQVAQYAENEVKLGNTGHMFDVANSAYIRLEKLREAVDEFKR